MVLIAGLIIFFTTDLKNTFSFAGLATNYSVITTFVANNQLASWLGFMLLYTVVVALSLPAASLLTLAGGAVLGWIAIPMIIIGARAGACVVFTAAKTVFASLFAERARALFRVWKQGLKRMPFLFAGLAADTGCPFLGDKYCPGLAGDALAALFYCNLYRYCARHFRLCCGWARL